MTMKNYNHIFLDLDKTLWDFTANTIDTFQDLFEVFDLKNKGIESAELFHETYEVINEHLWNQYRQGLIEKDYLSLQRYILTLKEFGIADAALSENLSKEYLRLSPLKTKLIPGTHDVLEYLKEKYTLHIITNGFNEVQYVKIKQSGLDVYFDKVITSQEAGYNKPNENIFYYALNEAGATATESLMIGDDIDVDIRGASKAGIDQVFVNFENIKHDFTPTFEVFSLFELMNIL